MFSSCFPLFLHLCFSFSSLVFLIFFIHVFSLFVSFMSSFFLIYFLPCFHHLSFLCFLLSAFFIYIFLCFSSLTFTFLPLSAFFIYISLCFSSLPSASIISLFLLLLFLISSFIQFISEAKMTRRNVDGL